MQRSPVALRADSTSSASDSDAAAFRFGGGGAATTPLVSGNALSSSGLGYKTPASYGAGVGSTQAVDGPPTPEEIADDRDSLLPPHQRQFGGRGATRKGGRDPWSSHF